MKKKPINLLLLIISLGILFSSTIAVAQPYRFSINTVVSSTVNPYIQDALGNPINGINVIIKHDVAGFDTIYVLGKLEKLTPPVFSIAFDVSSYFYNQYTITVPPFQMLMANKSQLNGAFFDFNGGLIVTGISSVNVLKDSLGRVKLPPGQYRICFYAVRSYQGQQAVVYRSNPNLGCATFNICKIDPPQLTFPSSNLAIGNGFTTVQPNTPVNFAWTPPLSNCGLPGPVNYDLEIREIFNSQALIDAINNPIVFRKTSIPSTTFLLDLNLYQNVLQRGRRYAVRVRAFGLNANTPLVIDNNGYSRVEAFQFGTENIATPNVWTAQLYHIPLEKRRSSFWDDYESRKGKDTLVPVDEYIAYKLMQQNIAYNEDAIELLVSLNPALKDKKLVHLYEAVNLPVLPEVPNHLRQEFEATHTLNLKPSSEELILFRRRLDTLTVTNEPPIPDRFGREYSELVAHLTKFNLQAQQLNSTSLKFINSMLSELIFTLRKMSGTVSNNDYNHLHGLASDIKALAAIPAGTTFLNKRSSVNEVSFHTSYLPVPALYGSLVSVAYYPAEITGNYYALTDQLLPLDIVVFRPVQEPGKPVMNAPDLKGIFKVFYTPKNLYNNRNPEINSVSPRPLASTSEVSLPHGVEYKFWTLNMLNQKLTLAQDIDIDEIFSNSQKKDLKGKRKTIILKVE